VTTKARVLSKPEPRYTEAARTASILGTVVLVAIFAADGTVTNVVVLRSLPFGLTERCLEAAKRIKFTSATKDGKLVSTFIQLEYNFNLYRKPGAFESIGVNSHYSVWILIIRLLSE